MDSISWYGKFKAVTEDLIPVDLLRYCLWSITFNDKAHDLNHVYHVCKQGNDLALLQDYDDHWRSLVLAGCLLHDIGCRYDRKTHHLIAYGLVFDLTHRYCTGHYSPEETLIIAKSCLEHRASWEGDFSHPISETVALADRGIPDFELYCKRAVQFRLDQNLTEDVLVEEVRVHMLDKFLPKTGYVWKNYPELGLSLYEQEWKVFHDKLKDEVVFREAVLEAYRKLKS
ncbi:hypothetical protein PQB86_gp242 [Klebsiella phage Miami]|uniref:Phosphohydrolase n=1 Tax=Klebsiella phage Miami TaxID=2767581 RepID=A0A873WD30_9CAUD|nr:hypothetical protein [Klebsiella quasipneumoniae]YP_010667421.1 hypothetical protein PQB86_gp242 [Klebsiella phage Miami]QPB09337.1 hypothetical protein CPT_Miami_242 [Klebsiella phage Miami]